MINIVYEVFTYYFIIFFLQLSDLSNYPDCPPELHCETPIFHPNISPPDGEICLNLLDFWSLGSKNFEAVVQGLIFLLREPNMKDPSWGNFDILNMDKTSFTKFIERLNNGDFSVFQEIYNEGRLIWTQWRINNSEEDGSESSCSGLVTSDTDYYSECSSFISLESIEIKEENISKIEKNSEENKIVKASKSFKTALIEFRTPALVRIGRFFSRSFRRLSKTFARH